MSLTVQELDVRPIPPRDKHQTIFRMLGELASGHSLIIVNDHDPKPLRYQLDAEHPNGYEWVCDEDGPDVWRVRIRRR